MKYISSDVECDRQNFLSFWVIFCPFTPLTTQKNRHLKKLKKKHGNIIILHKWQSYDIWFLRYEAWRKFFFFVILDCFLPLYPPNNSKSQNFEKLKKTPRDVIILHKCIIKYDHMVSCSWNMWCGKCI